MNFLVFFDKITLYETGEYLTLEKNYLGVF